VLAGLGQFPIVSGQFLADGAELDTVGHIAGVDPMQEGNMEVGADQQAETDLPEVPTLLLVVTALR
jgi:hypothetical protein